MVETPRPAAPEPLPNIGPTQDAPPSWGPAWSLTQRAAAAGAGHSAAAPAPAAEVTAAAPAIETSGHEAGPPPPGILRRIRLDLIALILAVAGGFMGIVGALITELQTDPVGIILLIFGAPVVEEALKPSGIFLLLVRWPMALRGRLHTAALCGLSGLVFGLVESLIYVEVYNPDGGDNFVLFRFTVTPALHIIASFMVGLGLSRATHAWAVGRQPLPRATRNWFMAGAGLHAAYNTLAIVLSVLGVLDFLDE